MKISHSLKKGVRVFAWFKPTVCENCTFNNFNRRFSVLSISMALFRFSKIFQMNSQVLHVRTLEDLTMWNAEQILQQLNEHQKCLRHCFNLTTNPSFYDIKNWTRFLRTSKGIENWSEKTGLEIWGVKEREKNSNKVWRFETDWEVQ